MIFMIVFAALGWVLTHSVVVTVSGAISGLMLDGAIVHGEADH